MERVRRRRVSISSDEEEVSAEKVQKLFDIYYEMGSGRSIQEFCKIYRISPNILIGIYEAYGWGQKLKELDNIKEREFEDWFKVKSKNIRESLTIQMSSLLESLNNSSLGLPLSINSVADLKTVSAAYSELVRATDIILRRPHQIEDTSQPATWADLLDDSSNKGV